MAKRLAVGFVLILTSLQFGCASKGFNRGELKNQIGVIKPSFDDQDIKKAYNSKSNLPKPFKLAIYFKSPGGTKYIKPDWRWTEDDKAILYEIGKSLKDAKMVSDVFPIVSSVVEEEDLKSLRHAAAKHQADALLIVSGAEEIDRYVNKWGWSYVLLLPALFVAGSEVDTLFLAGASLWDVKNEHLYLTAEAEAMTNERYIPAFGKENRELIKGAKTKALQNLKAELERMIKGAKL